MERKCIVCNNDNPHPRSKFCSEQCRQKYYYEKNREKRLQYKKEDYQENKQKYIDKAMDWQKKNRERWNEFQRGYQKLLRQQAKEEKENGEM